MTTRDRLSILLLLRCEGSDAYLNVNLRAGSEVPLATSGSGWAYLAALDPVSRERLLARSASASPIYGGASSGHSAKRWRGTRRPVTC